MRDPRDNLSPAELPFGAQCHVAFTKWDSTPHWRHEAKVLGEDAYGIWVGGTPGGLLSKPGREVVCNTHWVNLFPRDDMWVATFNDEGSPFNAQIYIDVTTVPSWWHRPDGILEVSAVDLDLDVIRRYDGEIYLADEDEFAEHAARMGYPEEIVAGARETADRLLQELAAYAEPFEQIGAGWLALCRQRFPGEVGAARNSQTSGSPAAATAAQQTPATGEPAPPQPDARREESAEGSHDWLSTWQESVLKPREETSDDPVGADADEVVGDEAWAVRGADTQPLPVLGGLGDSAAPPPDEPDLPAMNTDAGEDLESSFEPPPSAPQPEQNEWPPAQFWQEQDERVIDVERDIDAGDDIDTTPVDPADVTGLLVSTSEAATPLWFDGALVTPSEVGLPDELADHLYDWLDRWRRDWDPVRGWQPRAQISDYEALGRWLARRVKDEVGGVRVTLQLGHLGASSLEEIPGAEERAPIPVTLNPARPNLPVDGEFVTRDGVVGCFTSEVNTRLSAWAQEGGLNTVEEARLIELMSAELGPNYVVLRAEDADTPTGAGTDEH
ncbi:DUF402 domain-containing protein [Gephyromycinifex aptenodytis]|uniref:DUF402 domain-containing protein n=1 Tax=Gephyromycinifex aptenodytis TaxID=2716227 RepID=UPI001B2FF007|nr:DUF402 domain-containing protein [Gephyromycinifex aptenodytis]